MGRRAIQLQPSKVFGPVPSEDVESTPIRHLSPSELAHRLGVSKRTIEGWRYRGKGPDYLRLEGRIAYRLADVERFEAEALQKGRNSSEAPR